MDIFGVKTQKLLTDAQELLLQAQQEMARDIQQLKDRQDLAEARLAEMEKNQVEAAEQISTLQNTVDELRDSAIRGEVASGQKSKDVASKFRLSPGRVSQIAPRRRYNNG